MKRRRERGLTWRQFYALIWKDFVIHKRHHIWTLLEVTIPVLVCAMAILSNSHQGKPKLENERTFDPDDYERIYGDLSPSRHKLLVAPNSSFTRALVEQVDDGAVTIELCNSEEELVELIKREIPVSLDQVKRLLPDANVNVTIGGVVIRSDEAFVERAAPNRLAQNNATATTSNRSPSRRAERPKESYFEVINRLDGKRMRIPINLDMSIRAKDFRLGPEPFPKKYSLGPFLHADHYQATFFMASQIMLSRAYINLLVSYLDAGNSSSGPNKAGRLADIVIPTNDDIIGQRMPYPKYVAHKRLKETTLGTFVAGSQKQKPFVLTMDYCITVGFLVTAIFLAKRIVDEKKSRVRDMLRLVGVSDWTYYGSHLTNTMLIMAIQCLLITILFTGHLDAPAQNIDSGLMFAVLIIYCLASVMFVLTLSCLFNSSTKAIIFTSLLWLGLPEVIDRIFKMNSGVIESNGFWPLDEHYHLLFCLMPNFALRLMNRLLTECDIYGEFFAKKQLYGEYRAIWPNVLNVLPLYKSITVAHIMATMLASVPLYAGLIYLINSLASNRAAGLASLGEGGQAGAGCTTSGNLFGWLLRLPLTIATAPLKLLHQLIMGPPRGEEHSGASSRARANLCQAAPNVIFAPGDEKHFGARLNEAYAASLDSLAGQRQQKPLGQSKLDRCQVELSNLGADCATRERNDDHDDGSPNDTKYFEPAPGMLKRGVSIRNLSKTYFTSSSKLRRIDAVRNVSLDMFYSQILGKFH